MKYYQQIYRKMRIEQSSLHKKAIYSDVKKMELGTPVSESQSLFNKKLLTSDRFFHISVVIINERVFKTCLGITIFFYKKFLASHRFIFFLLKKWHQIKSYHQIVFQNNTDILISFIQKTVSIKLLILSFLKDSM